MTGRALIAPEAALPYPGTGTESCWLPGAETARDSGTGSWRLPGAAALGRLICLVSPGCVVPDSGYLLGAGANGPCMELSAYCINPLMGACNCVSIDLDGDGGGWKPSGIADGDAGGCNPPSIDMDGTESSDGGADILE
mmetsp:Transcript_29515/g.55276  ORF Transcript_29515/g.55276 Transcript_29515/m.55276 type:complete len:139 (+) Transcript_29515:33-449(+)